MPTQKQVEQKPFTEHLELASKIVSEWPEWKRTVLGAHPLQRSFIRAVFVPDDQGGHIEFNGKVWRPE